MLVVVNGDTMAGYGVKEMPREFISRQVAQLTARITAEKIACIWIGPSWGTEGGPFFKTYARVKELSDYLATIVSPCQYVDSLQLSKPGEWPTFDGVHYNTLGYQKWGAALTQVLIQDAASHAVTKR